MQRPCLNFTGCYTVPLRNKTSRGLGLNCSEANQPRCLNSALNKRSCKRLRVESYKVEIEHAGGVSTFDVSEGETVLETALENGLELSHDCKMGVCMTCPAKLISGQVDQSAGMLDEGVREKGYALLCVSEPRSDCKIKVIDEDEILEQVLGQ